MTPEELTDTFNLSSPRLPEPDGSKVTSFIGLHPRDSPVRPDQVSIDGRATHRDRDVPSPQGQGVGSMLDSSSQVLTSHEQTPWTAPSPGSHFNLRYADAIYLQHFASQLGRWLDCTDAARQLSMKIPQLAQGEELLLRAVACFAARHLRQTHAAAEAHEQCVRLLIPRLAAVDVASDDAVLCSIVVLRVFEQLDGEYTTQPTEAHSLTLMY